LRSYQAIPRSHVIISNYYTRRRWVNIGVSSYIEQ